MGVVAAPFVLVGLAFGLAYWWVVAWLVGGIVAIGFVMALFDMAVEKARRADDERLDVAARVSRLWDAPTEPGPRVLPPEDVTPFSDARVDLARHRSLRARFDGWRYKLPVSVAGPAPTRPSGTDSPPA
ncbi:hypothetical protein [Sandarakinorhabdus sp. DWP1-3-1]|uniref:hypothetical protein n=1 Tax=Sandarakinorhabdus sp. DWP1-3-1 TaxID=2804627 RepID=UPI003CF3C81C